MQGKRKTKSRLPDILIEQELNKSLKKINEDFLQIQKALALASSAADNLGKNLCPNSKEDIIKYSTALRILGESIDHYANRIACLAKYLPNIERDDSHDDM